MSEIQDLINIGSVLSERIEEAGIGTATDLEEMGAKRAFLLVKGVYSEACINHLYAIEGAIQGIRWHHLSSEIKADLKNFYDSL